MKTLPITQKLISAQIKDIKQATRKRLCDTLTSPHFSQSFVARPFKCRPIRPCGLKGAAGMLDSMSKSLGSYTLEGARPYKVDGWVGANE